MKQVYQNYFFRVSQAENGALFLENKHDKRCKIMISPHHGGMLITAPDPEDRFGFCVKEGYPAIKVEPIGGETIEEL